MKPLTLVPPAQAEALFDALEERSQDRFALLPWQDDDGMEETTSQTRTGVHVADASDRRRPQPQRRAA